MDVFAFDVHEFLSCGIDPNIVLAVQLLRNLSLLADSSHHSQMALLSADGPFPSIFHVTSSSSLLPHNATDEQMLRIVRLAVCCCAFFHGFETISEAVADQLVAVVVKKLDGMAKHLRTLGDQQRKSGRPIAAFKNPVHQVLESHALSASVLLSFYNSRVVRPCRTIAEKFLLSSHLPVSNKHTENGQK
ncbi:hypothetical protein niasHS_003896 [Heterodera schachtii]|uniref:Uncharacterized protein n=1 Tax=Heterodera schachtii TaxID=97005 RepID=A0ABD2K420_HETSC